MLPGAILAAFRSPWIPYHRQYPCYQALSRQPSNHHGYHITDIIHVTRHYPGSLLITMDTISHTLSMLPGTISTAFRSPCIPYHRHYPCYHALSRQPSDHHRYHITDIIHVTRHYPDSLLITIDTISQTLSMLPSTILAAFRSPWTPYHRQYPCDQALSWQHSGHHSYHITDIIHVTRHYPDSLLITIDTISQTLFMLPGTILAAFRSP